MTHNPLVQRNGLREPSVIEPPVVMPLTVRAHRGAGNVLDASKSTDVCVDARRIVAVGHRASEHQKSHGSLHPPFADNSRAELLFRRDRGGGVVPFHLGLAGSADVERPLVQDVEHDQFTNKRGNHDG
jgi:hypothetical protein